MAHQDFVDIFANPPDVVETQGRFLQSQGNTPVFRKPSLDLHEVDISLRMVQVIQMSRERSYGKEAAEWLAGHTPPDIRFCHQRWIDYLLCPDRDTEESDEALLWGDEESYRGKPPWENFHRRTFWCKWKENDLPEANVSGANDDSKHTAKDQPTPTRTLSCRRVVKCHQEATSNVLGVKKRIADEINDGDDDSTDTASFLRASKRRCGFEGD